MKKLIPLFTAVALCTTLTACYRMPTDDDYNINPQTNNPNITREKPSQNLMPKVGY